MEGDYNRYIAEVSKGEMRDDAVLQAQVYYFTIVNLKTNYC